MSTSRILCALALTALAGCSSGIVDSTGGASETVNAYVTVTSLTVSVALQADGAHDVTAYLTSADYDPACDSGFIDSLAADASEGNATFTVDSTGTYNLCIIDDTAAIGVLFADIVLADGVVDTLQGTLTALASVTGDVVAPAGVSWWPESTAVMTVGAPFVTCTDSLQHFVLSRLPAGAYRLLARPIVESVAERTREISQELTVTSGEQKEGVTLYFSN
ncbi:MAG: hypothetical protein GF331_09090 [Chitinivibrionales bacterium]|nr:hypothetical protein [Chitinivibrionales bacterium]